MAAQGTPKFSYFDLPRTKRISSESSDAVSPFSIPSGASPRTSPKPRPSEDSRSRFDYNVARTSSLIRTIKEEHTSSPNESISESEVSQRPGLSPQTVKARSIETRRIHSRQLTDHSNDEQPDDNNSLISAAPTPTLGNDSEPFTIRAAPMWKRTISDSSIQDKTNHSRDPSCSSSDARRPVLKTHNPQILIRPLQPPIPRDTRPTRPSLEHSVRVETSFTNLRQQAQQGQNGTRKSAESGTSAIQPRHSSVNPLHIFSSPFIAIRRYSRIKRGLCQQQQLLGAAQDVVRSGHDLRTGWQKQNLAKALPSVTTILQDIGSTTVARVFYERSASTDSRKATSQGPNDSPKSPWKMERAKSMEMVHDGQSQSSSLLRLRLGPQPPNTPNEKATYRVQKRSSAETEEFLKIDISVRGETSYLPSEARRVHTPPLPKEGLDGKRRGFFFDYSPYDKHAEGVCHGVAALGTSVQNGSSRAAPIDQAHSQSQRPLKRMIRTKTGDWFATQLAQLEHSDDIRENRCHEKSQRISSPNRSRSSTHNRERCLIDDEASLDFSIPEHLPTSPLCPRHPRYWRVVKGKGSQFRGCWMHGFETQ